MLATIEIFIVEGMLAKNGVHVDDVEAEVEQYESGVGVYW